MGKPLVVLEDDVLYRMAKDPRYTAAFPFLRRLAEAVDHGAKPVKRCCRKKLQTGAFATAKAVIAGMDAPSKVKLRTMLGADKVRVRYVAVAGGASREFVYTF